MGECGCMNHNPDFKLKGENGVVYTISKYKACDYCVTPHGYTVFFHERDDELFDTDHVPELPFQYGYACLDSFNPWEFKQKVIQELKKWSKEFGEPIDEFTVEEVMDEVLRDA